MGHPDYIVKLGTELGTSWPMIQKASDRTRYEREKLEKLLGESCGVPLSSSDASIVVFGSLAREELTSEKSDIDWIYLIDGQASPGHFRICQEINEKITDAYLGPGRTGVFGNMVYSHDLIHSIGGEQDTNSNITKRMLLMLESIAIGRADAHGRVVKQVLERYLSEEPRIVDLSSGSYRVPHFLLNDVVRFWRTMAVDFATKQSERGGAGWGLRNAKLRFSRKLLFVVGLLMCFSYSRVKPDKDRGDDGRDSHRTLMNHILEDYVLLTPLQILARELIKLNVAEKGKKIFGAYDTFLSILASSKKREMLENLRAEDADGNELFKEVREQGKKFREGLEDLFFNTHNLCDFTKRYGVF